MTFFVAQVDVFPSEPGFHISFQALTHGVPRGRCCVSLTIWKRVKTEEGRVIWNNSSPDSGKLSHTQPSVEVTGSLSSSPLQSPSVARNGQDKASVWKSWA